MNGAPDDGAGDRDAPGAPGGESGGLRQAAARRGSFGQTFKAVAWSFFGVRKASDYERDVSQLNPVHVIVAGILAAAAFVLILVLIVRWAVGAAAV